MIVNSPRGTFDRHLQTLSNEVLVLGNMVEQTVINSVDALMQRNLEASRKIYAEDREINKKRYEIESAIIALIATQQPMARDLRLLAAFLEIITELERIADYAKGISKINLLLGLDPAIEPVPDIQRMAELATDMLHRALMAFVNRDVAIARKIPFEDDAIDSLYDRVYQAMLDIVIGTPSTFDQANYQIWAAHNLERMADRITNICERIVFAITGEIVELDQALDVEGV